METFPRILNKSEKILLFSVLPEKKPGYNHYRDRINELLVIGKGRFERMNYILGKEGDEVDLSIPSSPVFANGVVKSGELEIDVSIHEESDEQIEYDISSDEEINDVDIFVDSVDSFSFWKMGDSAPFDNSDVSEYIILPDKYILAVAPSIKKIWLHDQDSGINHIIPLSNFYNELMRFKNIRETEIALKPKRFFEELEKYCETDIVAAFLMYDKYMNRFNLQQKL